MDTLITIKGPVEGNPPVSYTVRDLNRMARALVGKAGKVFAITIQFDELNGRSRLIASYETEQNKNTFTSCAI